MKRRDFVIRTAVVVGALPVLRSAFGQVPCPPPALSVEGGTSATSGSCGDSPPSSGSLVQVAITPEQIALYTEASSYGASAYATVKYKLASASAWTEAHPLYRVRPGTSDDAFAGCIFDLQPGQTYDVRVAVEDNGSTVFQDQFTTRPLPADVSQQTPDATPSSLAALQTAINAASPGDVIELQDNTYNLSTIITIAVSGTAANPIYIRGQSQSGTIINTGTNRAFYVHGDHIVIENMTIDGEFPVDYNASLQPAVRLGNTSPEISTDSFTLRNCVIQNFPDAVLSAGGSSGILNHNVLIYNNTLSGTLTWGAGTLAGSYGWNNDGLRLVGYGNCVWNNTMDGYGDSITFAHSVDEVSGTIECNYAYRNFIRNSINDTFELDHCQRFIGIYDNYCENIDTGISQSDNDSVRNYGPTYVFRNIFVNIAIVWAKLNDGWQGWHWYNNTFVQSAKAAFENPEYLPHAFYGNPGGTPDQRRFAYRNNLHVHTQPLAAGNNLVYFDWLASVTEFDVSHNAWYPNDGDVVWTGPIVSKRNATVADAIAWTDTHNTLYPAASGLTPTPYYHDQDKVVTINPWTNTLTLGNDSLTEVTGAVTLELDSGSNAKNAGVAIPNITDGYSGAAPDMGAVIEGRQPRAWGAQ